MYQLLLTLLWHEMASYVVIDVQLRNYSLTHVQHMRSCRHPISRYDSQPESDPDCYAVNN